MSTVLTKSFPQEKPAEANAVPRKKRVVIVGGGFAGIAAARALKRSNVDILLLDRRNHHIFQPLLYQVATAVLAPSEIAAPLRQLEAKQKNVGVLLAEVKDIRPAARTIEVICPGVGNRKFEYDFLVVATGMHPSYFGHDEFARFAPGLKSLNDAETIRTRILSAFELAESTDDEKERARQMTFVLVGAGPTGVELAASIAQLVSVTLSKNFRNIDPAKSRIVLLDGGARVLSTFAESLSKKVAKRLSKLGVEVVTGVKVERVDDQGVVAAGERIPSATVLWTAGVAASPVVKMLGTTMDRAGRALVGPFLDIPEAPDVFVVGDAAAITQDGHPVPGVAQAAIQQGRFVGRLIANRARGRKDGRPFRYRSRGNMAVVGKNFAVLEAGWLRTGGFPTWLVWAVLHVLALPQLQNRFRVQTQWFWSYLTGQRSSRLISEAPRPPASRYAFAPASAAGKTELPVGNCSMEASIISALAALTGSTVGGLTSVAANWLNQKGQIRAQWLHHERNRRQILYRNFIEEASKCYIDALQHHEADADIPGLVGLYAKLGQIRVLSSRPVVHSAEHIAKRIMDTYLEPDKSFVELRDMARTGAIDLLREFSETCRDEFEQLRARQF